MDDEPTYYFEIYPVVVKNNKPRNVFYIGDVFMLDKFRHVKVGRNGFTHKQIGIPIDSIIKYINLRHALTEIVSFRVEDGVQIDVIREEDPDNFLKMKNEYDAIKCEWVRIATEFLAWKRRRQVIMAWELEYCDAKRDG